MILFDETICQLTREGRPMPVVLAERGILPGIKGDQGTVDLPGFPEEKMTQGLDGLRERLVGYRELLARFTRWRAVIKIGDCIPCAACTQVIADRLACFAALSQEAGLVSIVEPEVLLDGAHDLAGCEVVTAAVLSAVFTRLREYRVLLEGMLLKPNMVLAGKDCPQQASAAEVAAATLRCLRRVVPAAVPGIAFLSGGQSPEQATAHLNAMNAIGPHPWQLAFSFARALQDPVRKAWQGEEANRGEAQRLFVHRARCSGAARRGERRPHRPRALWQRLRQNLRPLRGPSYRWVRIPLGALRDPARYPHPVDRVEIIETRISWVTLAGRLVYKIKKPVDLGFLISPRSSAAASSARRRCA